MLVIGHVSPLPCVESLTRDDPPNVTRGMKMIPSILLTGSSGNLGRRMKTLFDERGCPVSTLSRRPPEGSSCAAKHYSIDLLTPDSSLNAAVNSVDVVVHCAGAASGDDLIAENLVRAAVSGRRPHLVFISVIGADRVPQRSWVDRKLFGYYGAKRRAEEILEGSALPWTILRAAQFHQLLMPLAESMGRLPLVPVPKGISFQPVDAGEVAQRMLELALAAPSGYASNVAGPEVLSMQELLSCYFGTGGRGRPFMQVPLPGAAAAALRRGANLDPAHAVGKVTWAETVTAHLAVASGVS
jgi:uncharacterized protein YbjT (DUF2867 family)